MSETVKRVAAALLVRYAYRHGGWTDRSQDEFEEDARAAIAAMREPTQDMATEGAKDMTNAGAYNDVQATAVWKNMIDRALK